MATATVQVCALFFVPLVVLATAEESFQLLPDVGSGSDERLCLSLPPPESQESALATVQCHLACMNLTFAESLCVERDDNSTWPYYEVLRGNDCTVYHQQLEECNRGCLQRSADNTLTPPECRDACYRDCTQTGGIFGTDCSKSWCKLGCKDAYNNIIKTAGGARGKCPPKKPGSPIRFQLNNTMAEYYFDLTESAPDPMESCTDIIEPTGFIFKIQDTKSEWVTSIGKKSPRETISLAAYACMKVAVSFAAVNKHGSSEYSPEINITVDGDCTAMPGAVERLTVEAELDTRLQFFGHAILKISWDPPQQNADCLDHFVVEISPISGSCGTKMYSSGHPNETSLIVQATNTSESLGFLPVVGCSYDIKVYSIPGNQSSTADIRTPPYSLSDKMIALSCNRVPNDWYFSFYMNWTIPEQVAFITAIKTFEIWKHLVDVDGQVIGDYSIQIVEAESNKTNYMILVDDDNMVPNLNDQSQYSLQMQVLWKDHTLSLRASDFSCPLFDATAPPPKPIKNFTLDSYCTYGDKEIQLDFSWVPPDEIFGELTEYEVSIGPDVLTAIEGATANGFFTSKIAVNTTSARWSTLFISYDTLYFQMRAHSNWSVASNWTEPKMITSAQLDGCTNTHHTQQLGHIYGIVAGIVIVAIGLLFFTVLVCKLRKRKRQLEKIMDESNIDPMFSMGPKKPIIKNPDVVLLADAWELLPTNVIIEECLGEGAFGEVFKGIIKGTISNPKIRPSLKNAICATVAIKLLKPIAKGSERRDFLQEIEMMKKVSEGQNAHVVSMVGCITVQEPLCLVTEFVKHGDLLTYLRTNRKLHTGEVEDDGENPYYDLGSICPLDLISFAYQIASGMEYLSSLGIVHRDLACRNVLVDEGKVLKITDFGMSRETDEIYVQKSQGRVPLKWMAVESIIAREFTTASDVWSYGILLWEIGTLGGFPYPSIQNEDLLPLLKSGYRMEKPNNCSPEVYDIMLECWNEEARKRPTFTQLRANFDAMLLDGHKDAYIDLQIDIEKPYYKKDQLQVSPALKRKSQLSIADVQVFRHEFEKSPSHNSASSAQGSPLLPRISFLGASPSHEQKSSRPTSMLVPRAPEHTQPMNPYVDDPSKLARTFATTLAVPKSPLVSRATSEGNLPASAEGGKGPTNIRITVTPEP